jgi:cephalosporin-C deacetylase-like acetyl esterase
LAQQQLKLTPYSASGIYDIGEKVGWKISAADDKSAPPRSFAYTIKKNNLNAIKSGNFDLSPSDANIDVTLDEPAMVFLEITPSAGSSNDGSPGTGAAPRGGANRIVAGAAVAPTKLQPVVPRPGDFDSFWESKIKTLKEVPENAVLTPGDSGVPNVDYATIQMDHVDGKHVWGQLAKPSKEGKYPALVIFQWASPPYPLQKSWVTSHAANGWLTLNIEPHDVLPTEPQNYYTALPREIKNYQSIGNDDRDKSYFVQMYLADYRAVDYIASRPDWDGKTLVVMGTSMGGQQSLCVAGLHPKITHLIVNEPAGCDTNGQLHGRQAGYPNFPPNNPKIMETALYVDAVNFAPHINAKSLVSMGFVDTIAPPVGIWTALNQIAGAKEAVPMIDSPHNNLATPAQQRPYTGRSNEWLSALVKGEEVSAKQ